MAQSQAGSQVTRRSRVSKGIKTQDSLPRSSTSRILSAARYKSAIEVHTSDEEEDKMEITPCAIKRTGVPPPEISSIEFGLVLYKLLSPP